MGLGSLKVDIPKEKIVGGGLAKSSRSSDEEMESVQELIKDPNVSSAAQVPGIAHGVWVKIIWINLV